MPERDKPNTIAGLERAVRARARRRRGLRRSAIVVLALAAIAAAVLIANGGARTTPRPPPGAAAPLAPLAADASGRPVNGIRCERSEQVLFHIHAHLAVFVDGRARVIPEGIGIAPPRGEQETPAGPFVVSGSCFYWLHSHTRDGIIHIESPIQRTYRLGDYFAIWRQPLGRHRVGPARGTVTAYVDGRRFAGDPRAIPLRAHALVQLDVGARVRPRPFAFPTGL
jgi:hypothetical protein